MRRLRPLTGEGVFRLYEPLAKHTTLRVGGPAQFWVEPETESGFARLVDYCSRTGLPLMVMGRGSNLLIRDGGIPGVVAHLGRGEFRRMSTNGLELSAGAGVKFKELAMNARAAGVAGFEWMEGIPGSVGGGLRMNAGAMGVETTHQLVSVRVVDARGQIHTRTLEELEVYYRSVPTFKREFVLSAVFKGHPGVPEEINRLLEQSMNKRRSSQPKESSAGCIFKNPSSCPAGKLVDDLGLKNSTHGGARVSDIHGNFIVNDGEASASDVLGLIEQIKATVQEQRGIALETEVQIVGVDKTFIR